VELGLNSTLAVDCCELPLSEVKTQAFGLSFTLNHRVPWTACSSAPSPSEGAHFIVKTENNVFKN